jgi:RimJ/RimL family protein N-acetyltransferase
MTIARDLPTLRLMLRVPNADDLPAYTAYCAGPRSTFVRGPFSKFEAFDKLAAMIGHWALRGFGRYTMVHDGAPIGHVGPLSVDDSHAPEFTWTLWNGTAEGQGFAIEAARAVRDHLFTAVGWQHMLIRIQPDNHPSIRLADRLGAQISNDPAPDWYPGCTTYHLNAQVAA